MKQATFDAAVRMGHCDHIRVSELRALWERAEVAEARVRELEAELEEAKDAWGQAALMNRAEAAEQKLADANALLDRVETSIGKSLPPELRADIRAHLAAPSRTSCIHHGTHHCLHHAAPSRTEAEAYERWLERIARLSDAERAVLDAMGSIPEQQLRFARFNGGSLGDCARAELARRGLK